MGLFMSKEEKTCRALEKLCRQCAEEANDKYTEALAELKNGVSDQSYRIKKLNGLYAAGYGHDIIDDDEYAALYAYRELSSGSSILAGMYRHCLYTGLVFRKIQQSDDKNLSEEALNRLEHNDYILNYIRPYTPAKNMLPDILDKTENYILKAKSVNEIMRTDIELF